MARWVRVTVETEDSTTEFNLSAELAWRSVWHRRAFLAVVVLALAAACIVPLVL